jgi:iron(III) transport system substrate-binding protein
MAACHRDCTYDKRFYLALSSKAPHPNVAKVFVHYYLGGEVMNIIAKTGEFLTRKRVYSPLPDADKAQHVPMDELDQKRYAEKKQEYRKIFLR